MESEILLQKLDRMAATLGMAEASAAVGSLPEDFTAVINGEVEPPEEWAALVDAFGERVRERVGEDLFVDIEGVSSGEDGSGDVGDDDSREGEEVVQLASVADEDEEYPTPGGVGLAQEFLGYMEDLDVEGEVPRGLAGEGGVAELQYCSDRYRWRGTLWRARALGVLSQMRLGMSFSQHMGVLSAVAQIELALILEFGDSVPEEGQDWSITRRYREIDRRLSRLRWIEAEQAREMRGLRGVWRRVTGERQVSGRELYYRMLEAADEFAAGRSLARGEGGRRAAGGVGAEKLGPLFPDDIGPQGERLLASFLVPESVRRRGSRRRG